MLLHYLATQKTQKLSLFTLTRYVDLPTNMQNTTSIPSGILIHPAVWPQRTRVENWGGCAPLGEGKLAPHLPACCQVSSWSVQPFGHNAPTLHTEQDRHRSDSIGQPGFGRPFVKRKRFALSYRTVVCPVLSCPICLSVTLVYYGQTV